MASTVTVLNENNIAENKADQAEAFAAGVMALDDLSDQELEARISKDNGNNATNYC